MENKVIEKVRKLLALAANNANVNEAAAATARAQELLFQHKLSMADIEISVEARETVGSINVDEETALQLKWKQQLMGALARGCFCDVVISKTRSAAGAPVARLILIGKPSDTQTVAYLYEYARREIDRLCAADGAGRGFAWANSFRLGAVSAIWTAMNTKRAEQIKPTATVSETALAVIKRDEAEVSAYMSKAFPRLRKGTGARVSRGDGFGAGVRAGQAINLGGGGRAIGAGSKQLTA